MTNTNEPQNQRSDVKQRTIDAPCDVVFQAFSEPGQLAQWWGPEGFTNSFIEFDLRAGGRWLFTMHGPDGKDYPNESEFLEVIKNEKVVIEHFSGHHFILTISFTANGNSTVVGWRQLFDTVADYQQISEFVAKANAQNLDRLASVVNRSKNIV